MTEGATGQTTNAVFTMTLNRASTQTVTVAYTTADGSATLANNDYQLTTGTVTFLPNQTTTQILVPVTGDGILEADETFFVELFNATNTIIGDSEGTTFIVNDDGWQAAGPSPIQVGATQFDGCIQTVAADPTNPNVLFIGSVNGGIWKSTDAASASPTWTPLTDFLPSLSIGSLEFDPTDATHQTLLAGIASTSSFGFTGGPLNGLLRTTDGGTTWTQLNYAPLTVSIRRRRGCQKMACP